MRLLVLSDTHVGHPGWDGFGERVFSKARKRALEKTPDVVLFCGDLVEEGKGSNKRLSDGLKLLQNIPARKRLWVAGNNDLEPLYGKAPFEEYMGVLQEQAIRYDVHLLDYEPFVTEGFAFVGNFAGWDLSLWEEPVDKDPRWPSTYKSLYEGMDRWHQEKVGLGIREMFNLFQRRLRKHLKQMSGHKIILTTHTVPTKNMILYGHSPDFDFRNSAMGWEDLSTGRPLHENSDVVLQFCGHTHRSKHINRPGWSSLINVSGKDQPFIFDLQGKSGNFG